MTYADPRTRPRIRLINPNAPLSTITMPEVIRKMTFSRKALFAPTGLTVCAAVVPGHWDVEVIDECVQDGPHVPKADCDIVGITAMTTQARRAYQLADAYRALGVTVVMGGIHPSAMPEDALPHCDAVCKGDGESTLPHVIADWERAQQVGGANEDPRASARADVRHQDTGTCATGVSPVNPRDCGTGVSPVNPGDCGTGVSPVNPDGRRSEHGQAGCSRHPSDHRGTGLKRIYDWTEYPTAPIGTPRKDLLDPSDYLVANPIQTTRGCPHACTFCTTPGVFGRKFRQRAIMDIVEEIKEAKERHRTWCFIFADDDFGGNHKWALELCAALEPLKISWASQCDILISRNDKLLAAMKRSGCVGLILGLESRKQDTLTEAGKRYVQSDSYEWRIRKIQSHGISLWGAFIFGFDHDTWQDLMFTTRWAQRMNLAMSCYPILTPYPGTGIWHQFEQAGRLITRNWDKYNGASIVFEPKQMSPVQLRHAQMAAFAEFFSVRSAFHRLRFWPVKKRAWLANLAVARGIRYYYGKHGRQVPQFSDFLDPTSRAWSYPDSRDETDETDESTRRRDAGATGCGQPGANVAELAVAQTDPFRQASAALGALNPVVAASRGRQST